MGDVKRALLWVAVVAAGIVLLVVGAVLVVTHLDTADKLSSVVGAVCSLAGLGLSVYGMILSRRIPAAKPGPQRVDHVQSDHGVHVVDGVAGDVTAGSVGQPSLPRSKAVGPVVSGQQSVTNVRAKGDIRVVRGVGGNVDLPS